MNKNENYGTMGKSKTYIEGSNRPEYSGKVTIEGVEYWLSGWPRSNESGPWIKLEFTRKDGKLL